MSFEPGGGTPAALIQRGNVFDSNRIVSASATSNFGGGGEWTEGASVTSVGDRFSRNSIPGAGPSRWSWGGGIGILNSSCALSGMTESTLEDGVVTGNSIAAGSGALGGAGVYVGCSPATTHPNSLVLRDSTVTENSAPAERGRGRRWQPGRFPLAAQLDRGRRCGRCRDRRLQRRRRLAGLRLQRRLRGRRPLSAARRRQPLRGPAPGQRRQPGLRRRPRDRSEPDPRRRSERTRPGRADDGLLRRAADPRCDPAARLRSGAAEPAAGGHGRARVRGDGAPGPGTALAFRSSSPTPSSPSRPCTWAAAARSG